jgi:hypothetical protein
MPKTQTAPEMYTALSSACASTVSRVGL